MIVLTLLHPRQSTPVQSWIFESGASIQVGRANDNDVILYSAVVSRHHLEIRHMDESSWELINYGANGTYIDGQPLTKMAVLDGMIIRLGESGPKIRIRLGAVDPKNLGKTSTYRKSTASASPDVNKSRSTFLTHRAIADGDDPE
ncbi:MAG: FHA domain-containing protein [Jaaginema sp. PMC 1079.18]|nr:FHA domain-containing protein [Jaaginema sp. PMC 1080.18]MEC4852147.1 FHA domain-containing protein [Jaaginema sp. PMC 1079.18]MEC4866276.1 FHA domain-containing protein [Jaaginema sp. PMC 1078.18]